MIRIPGNPTSMSLDPALRSRIESILNANRVVLFMKGQPSMPQCGFSAKAVGALQDLGVEFAHVNVLADQKSVKVSRPTATGRPSRSCTSTANWSVAATSCCRWPPAAS